LLFRLCFLSVLVFIARQHTVHLSVSPSVRNVPVLEENGSTYRHTFFSPYGRTC